MLYSLLVDSIVDHCIVSRALVWLWFELCSLVTCSMLWSCFKHLTSLRVERCLVLLEAIVKPPRTRLRYTTSRTSPKSVAPFPRWVRYVDFSLSLFGCLCMYMFLVISEWYTYFQMVMVQRISSTGKTSNRQTEFFLVSLIHDDTGMYTSLHWIALCFQSKRQSMINLLGSLGIDTQKNDSHIDILPTSALRRWNVCKFRTHDCMTVPLLLNASAQCKQTAIITCFQCSSARAKVHNIIFIVQNLKPIAE